MKSIIEMSYSLHVSFCFSLKRKGREGRKKGERERGRERVTERRRERRGEGERERVIKVGVCKGIVPLERSDNYYTN